MTAYYKKNKVDKKYYLLLLLDGNVCSGGIYDTKKDLVNYCKRELNIKEVKKWEK